MFFCGCSSSPKQTGPRKSSNWAYAPDSVSIHPLSRIRISEDKTRATAVVHVEFKDGDDFACRGLGDLFIKIASASGNSVITKLFKLSDPDVNRELFDNVTRTYCIELPTSPMVKSIKVQAIFNDSDEEVLSSTKKTINNNSLTPAEP